MGLRTTVLIALLVAGPLVGLPLSFITSPGAIDQFSGFLPEAVAATFWIVLGVGSGTLVLGTGLAVLVSFFEFPGRRWIEWTLVLPLAMPSYVFTLFALGLKVPGIRSTGGAVCVFTLVLYPYVYLLARAAFLSQSRALIEAARGLGMSRARAILRVGVPLARPAILGGVALALMEALADFGTVNLLGVRTFTDAIYRVWFEAFDRDAAMQLATLLVSVTLTLLALERLARGRARHAQLAARGELVPPVRLRGLAAAAAVVLPLALVALIVGAPLVQLAAWSVQSIRESLLPVEFGASVRNSLLLSGMSAVLVPVVALLLAYGARSSGSRTAATAARTATIGYGLPGSVVAVAVIVPLGWIDRRLDGAFGTGLLLTGTVIGLFYAYRRSLPRPRVGLGRVEPPAGAAPARRGRPRPGLRSARRAGARARAAPSVGPRDGGAARVRRGDEGAAGDAPAAPARRRHDGDRRLAGHPRVALQDGRAARADDRARRAAARGHDDPAVGPHRRERGGGLAGRARLGRRARGGARMSHVRMRGLSKSFGSVRAVRELNLDIEPGELLAVLGPSGCGKTTLLRMIAGFEQPDAGCVVVSDEVVAGPGRMVPPEKRKVGMVFQDYALFPHLTVEGNVAFGLTTRPREEREGTTRRTLELVGLQHKATCPVYELSGGERQRVALARALAPGPELVLLDEPFSNLDATLRGGLRREVELILRDAEATALLVTHDQEEALSLADRVAVMRDGQIVQVGPPVEVYGSPATRWAAQFVGEVNVLSGVARGTGVETELGVFDLRRPATGSVHVAVRPEQLELSTRDGGGNAEVVSREFRGHDVLYRLRHEGGKTLLVQLPSLELHEVGDTVFVRPAPAAVTALVD